jgi:hypothetical protein
MAVPLANAAAGRHQGLTNDREAKKTATPAARIGNVGSGVAFQEIKKACDAVHLYQRARRMQSL